MSTREYIVDGRLAMTRGSVLRVEDGPGVVIYVWEGELWLTQEGDRRDYYLRAGQWFRIERGGVAVVSALSRAVLSVTAPAAEGYARSIELAKAGSTVPVQIYRAAGRSLFRKLLSIMGAEHARQPAAS